MLAIPLLCLALAISQSTSPSQPAASSSTEPSDVAKLRAEAQAGDPVAEFRLGRAYETGDGVPRDDTLAVTWYRKAAEQGNPAAENSMGIVYQLGQGVEKNKEEAVSWYRKAARHGSPEAMFNLGACYYNGEGLPDDSVRAYAWFLVAQEAGNPAATEAVHRSETELNDLSRADAILQIGEMYEKGEYLPQSYENAARWYRKVADSNGEAALRLAAFMIDGVGGVKRDYAGAMQVCSNLAKRNYASAEYCVGFLHQHGLGVAPNPKEAAKWYEQSATRGSGKAALALAEMHSKGEGVALDRPEAYWLLFLAYRNGVPEAKAQAHALHEGMNNDETKRLDKKLRKHVLDPKVVYAVIDDPAPPDPARARKVPLMIR
jgi:hypothetical protein